MKEADVIILNCELTVKTDKLLSEEMLANIKNSKVSIINLMHRRLVDADFIENLLQQNKLGK